MRRGIVTKHQNGSLVEVGSVWVFQERVPDATGVWICWIANEVLVVVKSLVYIEDKSAYKRWNCTSTREDEYRHW